MMEAIFRPLAFAESKLTFEGPNMTRGAFRPGTFVTVAAIGIVALVVVPLYGYFYGYDAGDWWWFLGLHLARSLGISLCNHRLRTHRTFECHFFTKLILMMLAGTAWQGQGEEWKRNHKQHHKHTEKEWDPHSPSRYPGWRGFWWAHCVWIFFDVKRPPGFRGREEVGRFVEENKRLEKWDKWMYPIGAWGSFLLPLYFSGVGAFLLAGFGGLFLSLNITWSVNSIAHMFGDLYESLQGRIKDNSRNNLLYLLPVWIGEHFHRFHHAQQDSAFFGWKWYHPDLGKWVLLLGEPFKIFWGIHRPRPELIA